MDRTDARDRFWRAHNEHLLAADQQAAQLAGLRAAYAADSATLERLERANVYNDAFCIGHDGVFGTINGLRLGRVPGVPVGFIQCQIVFVEMKYQTCRLSGPRSMLHGVKRSYCCIPSPESWIIRLRSRFPN